MFYDFVGSVQNPSGRAVVLFETDGLCLGEYFLKIQDIENVCPAELVDGLVVVSDNAEIAVFFRKQAQKHKLRRVCVLVLIDKNKLEAVLVALEYVRFFLEQLDGFHYQIVKIQGVILFETLLVFFVHFAENFPVIFLCHLICVLFWCFQFIFGRGNRIQKCFFPVFFCVNIFVFADIFHQAFLVVRIVYRKASFISEKINKASENSDAGGVERADPDAFCPIGNDVVHPFAHLACRFVREREGENLIWVNLVLFNQPGDSVGQHSCFARTRAGKNEERSLKMLYGFFLFFI